MKTTEFFLIKWYGPFSSIQELKKWEDKKREFFNLYIFRADREKLCELYCGMTSGQSVSDQMINKDHGVHFFEDKENDLQIWIGNIAKTEVDERDIRVCEFIITKELEYKGFIIKKLDNQENKELLMNNTYIINEWWKIADEDIKEIKGLDLARMGRICRLVPEVMEYYAENNAFYSIDRLSRLFKSE